VLVDLVLRVLILLGLLRLAVGGLALAVRRGRSLRIVAGATASASFAVTALALGRALLLGDSLRRGVVVLGLRIGGGVVALGDVPRVAPATAAVAARGDRCIGVRLHAGRRGRGGSGVPLAS